MKKKDYDFENEQEKIGLKDIFALVIAAFQVVMPFFLVAVGIMFLILLLLMKFIIK